MIDVFVLQRAVWTSELEPLDRLVLLAIVSYWSAESPEPYPSWSALMQRTGLSRSTLGRRLQSLVQAGMLRVTVRPPPKGLQPTNHYDLTALMQRTNQSRSETSSGAKLVAERHSDQYRSDTPTSSAPIPEVSKELSRELSRAVAHPSKDGIRTQVGVSSPSTKKAKPRGSRFVPDGWQPSDSHRDKAAELGVCLDDEARKFRGWEFKTPKTNFDLAFHRWLNNATPRQRHEPSETLASRFAGYEIG